VTEATGAIFDVHFRRRREGKTDYVKRLHHLKSRKTRLIVRRTNRFIIVAFAQYDPKGDHIIVSRTSKELKKMGFDGKCNVPSAYLTAYWCAKEAQKKNVKDAILDMGLHAATKGNVIFAALKGAVDGGIAIPMGNDIAPSDDRIKGKHLNETLQNQFDESKKKIDAS